MNVEIGSEAAQFPEKEYINGISLQCIQRRPHMQFSMARKFTLRPLCRYDVGVTKKSHKHNFTFEAPCLEKTKLIQRCLGFLA
jgi:hypothetical protein